MFSYSTEKIGSSAFDSKRWICDDGISTYAFGRWKTMVKWLLRPDFRSFDRRRRIVIFLGKNINHGKEGLFYHKRKIHNCENVH